jgi:hypothetical protein
MLRLLNKAERRLERLAACTLLLLIPACGGLTPTYPGPRRSAEELATLTCEASIRMIMVDGREISSRGLELLPGEHRVHFKIVFRGEEFKDTTAFKGMRRTCLADAKFIAEPGVAYRLVKISRRGGPAIRTLRWDGFRHQFGAVLMDEGAEEVIEDAVSEMNCGS